MRTKQKLITLRRRMTLDRPLTDAGRRAFRESLAIPVCEHCDNTGVEPAETSAYPPEPCSVCQGRYARAQRRESLVDREMCERIAAARALANAVWLAVTVGLGLLAAWYLMR